MSLVYSPLDWILLGVAVILVTAAFSVYVGAMMSFAENEKDVYFRPIPDGAYIPSGEIAFDQVYPGSLIDFLADWTPDTHPRPFFRDEFLENLASCNLSARTGVPCSDARLTYAATLFAGAVTSYGVDKVLVSETACWDAPHENYYAETSVFSVTGRDGKLIITHPVFKDTHHNGSPEYVISDRFCATMMGFPYAINYWDDRLGDVFGCSAAGKKGANFIPIQCRVNVLGSAELLSTLSLQLENRCFGVDDLITAYNGSNPEMRCFVEENINACGGVAPKKEKLTQVVRVPAERMDHLVHHVTVDGDTISFIQWIAPEELAGEYLLTSDCVVFEPLCNATDASCIHEKTLADYLAQPPPLNEEGDTDLFYNLLCADAYFAQKEFFYVSPAYKEAAYVVASWPGLKLIGFDSNPPAEQCSSFSRVKSAGLFVVIDAQRNIESSRPLNTLAMFYDVTAVVSTQTEKLLFGDMCILSKGDADGEVAMDLTGIHALNTTTDSILTPQQQCDHTSLVIPSSIYVFQECVLTQSGLIDCSPADRKCVATPTRDVPHAEECRCCRQSVVTGDITSLWDAVQPCTACESGIVTIHPRTTECTCTIHIPEETITVWVYTPHTIVIPATLSTPARETVYPMHGKCEPFTIPVSETHEREIYHDMHSCITANNNCAEGYTLFVDDTHEDGTVKAIKIAERFGCFIDEPRWGSLSHCSAHCRADAGAAGGQWFAHSHGHCGKNCNSYAFINPGYVIDGGITYTPGVVMSWVPLSATTRMGNHFIPHYICVHRMWVGARNSNIAWVSPAECKAHECIGDVAWKVSDPAEHTAYTQHCLTGGLPNLSVRQSYTIPTPA